MGSLAYLVLLVAIALPCFVVCQDFRDEDDTYDRFDDPEPPPTLPPPISQGCENKVMDIHFILDSSTSIWEIHYQSLLPFVRDVVARLDVGPFKTRVGVVSYSDRLNNQPLLYSQFNRKADVRNYINLSNFPYQTGITDTFSAIRYVREHRETRQNITKVIVVVTDGFSSDPSQTAREAELARNEGFYLFVIGLGRYPDEVEWRAIADDPDRDFIHNATDFVFNNYVNDWVARKACALPPKPPASVCTLQNDAYASVYYISGSTGAQDSAYQFSNRFGERTRGRRRDVKMGFFFQNCNSPENVFGKADDYCFISDPASRFVTLSSLVADARNAATDERNQRGVRNQVAVIFLDDAIRDTTPIQSLQNDEIEVIIVDVTNRGAAANLRNTLTRQENYIRFVNQEASSRLVAERLCSAIHRGREAIDVLPTF